MKIVAERTFTRVVRVMVPTDKGHREETLNVKYRVVTSDRTDEIYKDGYTPEANNAFLAESVVSIDGLQDDAGQPIECTDDIREALLKLPFVRTAISKFYGDAIGKVAKGN